MNDQLSQTEDQEIIQSEAKPPAASARIMCVDVLRGFDMFWLVGGAGVALGIGKLIDPKVHAFIDRQLSHADWEGFYFYDLIFPLFVFLAGMSLSFSMGRTLNEKGLGATLIRLTRRCLLMFLLGVIYNGGFTNVWPEVRIMGVLQRIALSSLFAGVLFCFFDWRGLAASLAALLLGYWALLSFVPLPGQDSISWAVEQNWAVWLDAQILPGRLIYKIYDPEGILSTIPAIGTCIIGILTGLFLKRKEVEPLRKGLIFIGAGLVLVAAGYLWSYQCPIIKKIWTPSYVLVAGGWSILLLALFYFLVDFWQIRWWTAPFLWIGVNPLTVYMARNIIGFNDLAKRFVGGSIYAFLCENLGYFVQCSVSLGIALLFVWYLNKKKIYLRL